MELIQDLSHLFMLALLLALLGLLILPVDINIEDKEPSAD